ncbi:pyridine nucleotide-disulfide oxidoreductase [Leptospira weilii serovar Ranarum str. ICFT]|uniref:Pyridine nucleotide-disulfide oxidoreductase n=1 Tax=Leptospira weilii serovar Ranarum str. ICFT TaxID=1218598 RepID=N1WGB3_9LEPT|nr:NAD(P)-binding domain-containing protein [Leptospira weilii]EMY79311.1 pyridine nucleotide-disulfide oxidoreductase [Leptospira weilii serovar Ranarum str. ICFT]
MNVKIPLISRYFSWLHNNTPEGKVEIYPEVSESYESSIPGIRVIGDLTGLPLLKFAVKSGAEVVRTIGEKTRKENRTAFVKETAVYDILIVGAGPAGISAGIECKKLNYKFIILESNEPFHTVRSYPKAKPIFAEPKDLKTNSELPIVDGTKESLLRDLQNTLDRWELPIQTNVKVTEIQTEDFGFSVFCENGEKFKTKELVIAVGKSGNARNLQVSGEKLSKVFYRLIDPKDFEKEDVLVVGGGDSALEAAIAVSEYANSTRLSYRGKELVRPKSTNKQKFESLVTSGKIEFLKETVVEEILDKEVRLKRIGSSDSPTSSDSSRRSSEKIPNTSILVQIGSGAPIEFLKQIGLRIQSQKRFWDWIGFLEMILFANVIYWGKASFDGNSFYTRIAFVSLLGFIVLGIPFSIYLFQKRKELFKNGWNTFKNSYLFLAASYFCLVYVGNKYFGFLLSGKQPAFHYTLLYSLTILVFGLRRIKIKPTQYIRKQTWTLILIQIFPLFLLPEIILPFLGQNGLLGNSNGFLLTQVFPNGAYWNAYGFILAWPLNLGIFYNAGITSFWLIYGTVQTFGVIPLLVYRFGKGAYCGWICSCGGLAETLGDETRTEMPHGKFANQLENSGQWILLFASIITILKLSEIFLSPWFPFTHVLGNVGDNGKKIYDVAVDLLLAGVLGLGAYFFLSGRVWCRFFCPLAALMHIYGRFSKFRILSEKKKCISCNICTKVCHQGIDVMGYANKGIPMDNVQCVRCSECVIKCPTNVLSFGEWKR